MRILPFVFLLLMGMTWRCVQSTCVFETDFGLSINCGLKKSGLFRVRNLGGLKGYVGLGIQLADELGFKESLSTLEQNSKRRSVNGFPVPGSFEPLQAVPQKNNHAVSIKMYKTIRTILSHKYAILSYCFVYYTSGIILPSGCGKKIKTQIYSYDNNTHVVYASRSFAKFFITFYY